jgi:hypothetical protein
MSNKIIIHLILSIALVFAQSKITQDSSKRIDVEFTLPEMETESVIVNNLQYKILGYQGSHALVKEGAPLIPFSIKRVAIPPAATVEVRYQSGELQEMTGIEVYPLIVISGGKGKGLISKNRSIYNSPAAYPGKVVEISEPYTFKNMNVVDLHIFPVQYYPAEKRVQIIKNISIQLNIKGGKPTFITPRRSNTEKSILETELLNFEQAGNWSTPPMTPSGTTAANYDFGVGNWYKIPITEEGVYRITGGFLTNQGIDISSVQTDFIQMFNYSGTPLNTQYVSNAPDDLNEIAIEVVDNNNNGILNTDDLIYFYGNGLGNWRIDPQKISSGNQHPWTYYHHPYASTNYYLLTFNANSGKRIFRENSIQNAGAIVQATFTDHVRFEEDKNNLLSSGLDWYWLKMSGITDQASQPFTLPKNIAPGPVNMRFRLKDGSDLFYPFESTFRDSIDISINGEKVLDDVMVTNGSVATRDVSFSDVFAIKSGDNELFLQHNGNQQGCQSYLDYFEFRFSRPFIADNSSLKFQANVSTLPVEFRVSGMAGGGNRVWDITNFSGVRGILPIQNTSTVIFQDRSDAPASKQYLTFAPSTVNDVSQIIAIEKSPNLRDASRKGKLLIILPDEFYDAAEVLEDLKESQVPNRIETERIKLSEIYREFSSCVPDPTAIRNFIRWAYDNWRSSENSYPEYVMLLGDGSYDYKGIEATDYINRVPTFQIEGKNELDSRETDHFYVTLQDNVSLSSLKPSISIGRVPANSVVDVETFLEKQIQYANQYVQGSDRNGWQSLLTFVADDEIAASSTGEWFHMLDTQRIIDLYVPNKFDVKKLYLVEYDIQAGGFARLKPQATNDLLDQINNGTLAINYFGHGNPDTWAHEQLLVRSRDLPLINNEGKLPFWIAATCDWAKFDDPAIRSMGEEMIWQKDRGGLVS